MTLTSRSLKTLQEESDLDEIVKLVGVDALSAEDRLTLEVARSIREDFLQQYAFDDVDGYTPLDKQYALLRLIFSYEDRARKALSEGASVQKLADLPVREMIGRAKTIPYEGFKAEFDKIEAELASEIDSAVREAASEI